MRLKVKLVVPYYVGLLQRIQHIFRTHSGHVQNACRNALTLDQ